MKTQQTNTPNTPSLAQKLEPVKANQQGSSSTPQNQALQSASPDSFSSYSKIRAGKTIKVPPDLESQVRTWLFRNTNANNLKISMEKGVLTVSNRTDLPNHAKPEAEKDLKAVSDQFGLNTKNDGPTSIKDAFYWLRNKVCR